MVECHFGVDLYYWHCLWTFSGLDRNFLENGPEQDGAVVVVFWPFPAQLPVH